jgi:hypothetical protein
MPSCQRAVTKTESILRAAMNRRRRVGKTRLFTHWIETDRPRAL